MDRVRIGDIAEVKGGYSFKSEKFTTEGIPVIRIGDISENGIIPDENCKYDENFWNENEKFRINKNDILIAMSGATVGKSCINKLDEKLLLNQRVADIVVSEKAFPSYVYYNIRTPEFKKFAASQSNGSAQPNISGKQIADYKIPLPSLPDQQKIAAHLDSIQSAIDNKKQQLQQLDELVKSKFVEMFGENPVESGKWKVENVGNLSKEVKYGTSLPAVENGKYKYLRMNNLTTTGYLDLRDLKYIDIPSEEYEKCVVRKGDIIFNRTNSREHVGKTCLFNLDEEMIIAGYLIRVRLVDELNGRFFSEYMNTPYMKLILRKTARGAVNQSNINSQELQKLQVPVPPIELQNTFAEYVQKIDSAKSIVKTQLADLQELLDSKMDEYFGE